MPDWHRGWTLCVIAKKQRYNGFYTYPFKYVFFSTAQFQSGKTRRIRGANEKRNNNIYFLKWKKFGYSQKKLQHLFQFAQFNIYRRKSTINILTSYATSLHTRHSPLAKTSTRNSVFIIFFWSSVRGKSVIIISYNFIVFSDVWTEQAVEFSQIRTKRREM